MSVDRIFIKYFNFPRELEGAKLKAKVNYIVFLVFLFAIYMVTVDLHVSANGFDTTPPDITDVSQYPIAGNVHPEDNVKVNATVTDDLSGVKNVTLNYTNGNGTWIILEMLNLEGNIWNATIPKFPYDTNITYIISAEDNACNTISTESMGYTYQYSIITEFPSFLILPIFMITTLLVIIIRKRKDS